MIYLRLFLVIAFTLATFTNAFASQAVGKVFEDRNRNGRADVGEPGIAGVSVSNGNTVVQTDSEGRYRIDAGDEAIIFVTKPSGYAVPLNEWQLPQFYYIHQPKGSPPGLRYRGIEPTGELPDSIDFPLYQVSEPNDFSAILFADTQPQSDAEIDYIRDDVVAELIGTGARFGMTLGDIMFDDMSLFPRFLSVIGQIGIPWYNVPGNHEINFLAEDDRYSLETFKSYFGPSYYSFDYGDVHFVVLDNFEYKGRDPDDIRGNGGYVSRIGKQQLRWLKNDLEHVPDDKLIFLAMHGPLATYVDPTSETINTQDRRELFKLLTSREHLYAVAGHTHTTEHHYFDKDDGFNGPGEFHHHILTTVSGSWWSGPLDERGIPTTMQRDGTPNGYHILRVQGTELVVDYKAAGKPETEQMSIYFDVSHHRHQAAVARDFRQGELNDGRFTVDELSATEIVVNLYDGGPKSRINFRIDDGDAIAMAWSGVPDLQFVELLNHQKDHIKPWVKTQRSSHTWSARMPGDLGPGTYTVSVEAIDEFGRTHHAHKIIEITGSSASQKHAE